MGNREERLHDACSQSQVRELGYEFTGETRIPLPGDLFWNGSGIWIRHDGTAITPRPILVRQGAHYFMKDTHEIEAAHAIPMYEI